MTGTVFCYISTQSNKSAALLSTDIARTSPRGLFICNKNVRNISNGFSVFTFKRSENDLIICLWKVYRYMNKRIIHLSRNMLLILAKPRLVQYKFASMAHTVKIEMVILFRSDLRYNISNISSIFNQLKFMV